MTKTPSSRVRNTRESCTKCGKTLGATSPVCFTCGGTQSRGPRIGPEQWQILLGIGASV